MPQNLTMKLDEWMTRLTNSKKTSNQSWTEDQHCPTAANWGLSLPMVLTAWHRALPDLNLKLIQMIQQHSKSIFSFIHIWQWAALAPMPPIFPTGASLPYHTPPTYTAPSIREAKHWCWQGIFIMQHVYEHEMFQHHSIWPRHTRGTPYLDILISSTCPNGSSLP